MLSNLRLKSKMLGCLITGRTVGGREISSDYNQVAVTYQHWCDLMGQHTISMLEKALPLIKDNAKVLDLACGNGFITQWLQNHLPSPDIIAVDISPGMTDLAAQNCPTAQVITADVHHFLDNCHEKFDLITCGWALPYLHNNTFIDTIHQKLNPGGIACFITNIKGTLKNLNEVVMETMKLNPAEITNIFMIRESLPSDEYELAEWFNKNNLVTIQLDAGEETCEFVRANDLLDWLLQTGAGAGIRPIFRDFEKVRPDLITAIEHHLKHGECYTINHKFSYGIFQKA